MKEATGEVSGTVITIVLIAAVLGIAMLLFKDGANSPAYKWITGVFTSNVCGEGYKMNKDTGECVKVR